MTASSMPSTGTARSLLLGPEHSQEHPHHRHMLQYYIQLGYIQLASSQQRGASRVSLYVLDGDPVLGTWARARRTSPSFLSSTGAVRTTTAPGTRPSPLGHAPLPLCDRWPGTRGVGSSHERGGPTSRLRARCS